MPRRPHRFETVPYQRLNARQKENFNFAKVSAVLADFGFVTMRLSDDWQGADFIAQHVDGETILRVQLKSRLAFNRKYRDKDLYIAFCSKGQWYLFPHDKLLDVVLAESGVAATSSWQTKEAIPILASERISLRGLSSTGSGGVATVG